MFNPIDILDKDLYYKTPLFNSMLRKYLDTYGKDCLFYINPNNEASENNVSTDIEQSIDILGNNIDSKQRTDNYSLAYGKDKVGYDYSKLQKVNAKIMGNFQAMYVHEIGAENTIKFYLYVNNAVVSRGDVVSIKLQNKELFYRIDDKINSYFELYHEVNCKLIEVNKLNGGIRPYDIHEHSPDVKITPNYGVIL